MKCIDVCKAVLVRVTLGLHCVLSVWRVTVMLEDTKWWFLACGLGPFVIEGLVTIIKRNGKEFKWVTPCFFLYLCATVPCVWFLELNKTESIQEGRDDYEENKTPNPNKTTDTVGTYINKVGLNLNPNTWTILIEELMLYLLILSRWVLPRGEITREQLSELLFAFISIASDIMEMFSLFGEEVVRERMFMNYWILAVWSVSVLQFTMTITVTHQPKRAKKILTIIDEDKEIEKVKTRNEIFAIFLSMFMQDVPFLVIRLYTIIRFDVINYSLVFFTAKNILVITLLFYKIAILLSKRCCPDTKDDNEAHVLQDFDDIPENRNTNKGIIINTPDGLIVIKNNGQNVLDTNELKRRSLSSLNSQGSNNNTRRARGNEYTNMVQPAVSMNDSDIASDAPSIQPYSLPNPVQEVFPSTESININKGHDFSRSKGNNGPDSLRSISSKGKESTGSGGSKRSTDTDSKKINSITSNESKGYNSMKSNKSINTLSTGAHSRSDSDSNTIISPAASSGSISNAGSGRQKNTTVINLVK